MWTRTRTPPIPQTRVLSKSDIQRVQKDQYNKILSLIDGIDTRILRDLDRTEIRIARRGEDWRNNAIEVARALKEAFGLHEFMPVSTEVPVGRVQITNAPDGVIIKHIEQRIAAKGLDGMRNLICSFMNWHGLQRFTINCKNP